MDALRVFACAALIFLIFGLPQASSMDADITIQTDYAFRSMVIRVLNENSNIVDSLSGGLKTDINGELKTNYSTSLSELGFIVFIVENGNVLDTEEFDAQPVNEPIVLDMRSPAGKSNNLTTESKTESGETLLNDSLEAGLVAENVTNATITGQAISGDFEIPSIFYYFIGVLLLAAVIGFVVGRMIMSRKIPGKISEKPAMVVRKEEGSEYARELAAAERRLKEAQAEVSRIRSTDRIKQAEEKLKRDAEELERLRKGEE